MVAQWLAHLRLVLEVQGTIPPHGEENFGVPIRFLNSLVPFAGMTLDKCDEVNWMSPVQGKSPIVQVKEPYGNQGW